MVGGACDWSECRALPHLAGARLEPSLEGALAFARTCTAEQRVDADDLSKIRPEDPFTAPEEVPVTPLDWRATREARVPCDWHRDTAAVREIPRRGLGGHLHPPLGHGRPMFNR